MTSHQYKGHTIALKPMEEGYMWACQYVIRQPDESEVTGFPDGNTYTSREQAESAALAKAQILIDESIYNKEPLEDGC